MVVFDVAGGNANGIGDVGLGPGLFKAALVGLEIGKMKEVLGADVLEKDFILVIVVEDLEIFGAADAMVVVAFGTNEDVLPQFGYGTDIITIGAFGPESFRCLLFFRRAGQDTLFYAAEPTTLTFFTLSLVSGQIRFKIVVILHFGFFTHGIISCKLAAKILNNGDFRVLPSPGS